MSARRPPPQIARMTGSSVGKDWAAAAWVAPANKQTSTTRTEGLMDRSAKDWTITPRCHTTRVKVGVTACDGEGVAATNTAE